MGVEIQRASMWKRISAWLFDGIILVSVIVLVAYALSGILGYDRYSKQLDDAYERYETQYNVDLRQKEAPEDATAEEKAAYKERYALADEAIKQDKDANYALGMIFSFYLLIPTIGVLIAMLIMEFAIPMMFGNGQTLGKKIFSLGVVRVDAVKLTTLQLFVRTVLSKYTVGTMIPVALIAMALLGVTGSISMLLALGFFLVQLLCPLFNYYHRGIHDLLSGTVVVDLPSQRVFSDANERIEYIKKQHAQRAERQTY